MSYENRRYRMGPDGRLEKRWDATDEPGWFKTKVEAWGAAQKAAEAVEPQSEPEPPIVPRRRGRPRKTA